MLSHPLKSTKTVTQPRSESSDIPWAVILHFAILSSPTTLRLLSFGEESSDHILTCYITGKTKFLSIQPEETWLYASITDKNSSPNMARHKPILPFGTQLIQQHIYVILRRLSS